MSRKTRRQFFQAFSATLGAPAVILALKKTSQLPLSFSTLGCPRWDWKTILEQASRSGYSAIEFRGIKGEMDLTRCPEFSLGRVNQSLQDLKALGLRIINLGSSAHLHEKEPAARAAQLDEGRRFIDLAHRLSSPYVRVFGDKYVEGETQEETLDRVVAGLQELGGYAKSAGVTVILESHGDFHDSPTLLKILKGAEMPSVGLLWDTHHTFVSGKESPATTFSQLGRYVRHTHLKDSKPEGTDVRYVLTGTGTIPLQEIVRVLVQGGYKGYYSFEWEKAWHPEIDEPEVAIPQYAKSMREYLARVGVTPS
ncbi:MAG TPA: sugar phosphate isomerase/epimerase family protein [Terriglobia bacterium]|nr:sugar phosphate isomerase/epimerase family protein [Terriglobia bacterium]